MDLTTFNNTISIQIPETELDPSLNNGFKTIYDREVPFEVRTKHGEERAKQGSLELIKVKILLAGLDDSPNMVRLEFSSESDLFFHYIHIVDEKEFLRIQESQKLVVDFIDYATVLIRMLNACIKEPHIHLAILTIFIDNNTARLDFIQNMEYKFVELMYCNCLRSPEEIVQNHITFRYNNMKQKLSFVQNRLQELTNLVKIKNPSLLLQLQKHGGGGGGGNSNGGGNNNNGMAGSMNNTGMMGSPGSTNNGGGHHHGHSHSHSYGNSHVFGGMSGKSQFPSR
jgi:hypothetical protein